MYSSTQGKIEKRSSAFADAFEGRDGSEKEMSKPGAFSHSHSLSLSMMCVVNRSQTSLAFRKRKENISERTDSRQCENEGIWCGTHAWQTARCDVDHYIDCVLVKWWEEDAGAIAEINRDFAPTCLIQGHPANGNDWSIESLEKRCLGYFKESMASADIYLSITGERGDQQKESKERKRWSKTHWISPH